VFRPSSTLADNPGASRVFVPVRVQVEPYRPPAAMRHLGLWGRVRRVLFGVTEPEAGA